MSSIILEEPKSMWEKAIDHCQKLLSETKPKTKRADQLRSAIATFRANMKRGLPWPGESATHN